MLLLGVLMIPALPRLAKRGSVIPIVRVNFNKYNYYKNDCFDKPAPLRRTSRHPASTIDARLPICYDRPTFAVWRMSSVRPDCLARSWRTALWSNADDGRHGYCRRRARGISRGACALALRHRGGRL